MYSLFFFTNFFKQEFSVLSINCKQTLKYPVCTLLVVKHLTHHLQFQKNMQWSTRELLELY